MRGVGDKIAPAGFPGTAKGIGIGIGFEIEIENSQNDPIFEKCGNQKRESENRDDRLPISNPIPISISI